MELEERTDSGKSEVEAATTIQAVYRGYKTRRKIDEVGGYIYKIFLFLLEWFIIVHLSFFFNSSNENFSYKIVKWKVSRVTLKLEMLIAGIVIIIYFFCKVFDSFRFFKWQIRKSTSEEKRNVKKVAELLSIPMDETLRNSSMEPIRISSSPVNQMRNEKDEIAKLHSLSPRNKNRGQSILQNQSKRCVEDQMNQVREHGNFSLR